MSAFSHRAEYAPTRFLLRFYNIPHCGINEVPLREYGCENHFGFSIRSHHRHREFLCRFFLGRRAGLLYGKSLWAVVLFSVVLQLAALPLLFLANKMR